MKRKSDVTMRRMIALAQCQANSLVTSVVLWPEHVSGAGAAEFSLVIQTFFCDSRFSLRSTLCDLLLQPFFTPAHRSTPAHWIFGPVHSPWRSLSSITFERILSGKFSLLTAPFHSMTPCCAPAPSFSYMSAPVHSIFGPLFSVFRSAHMIWLWHFVLLLLLGAESMFSDCQCMHSSIYCASFVNTIFHKSLRGIVPNLQFLRTREQIRSS